MARTVGLTPKGKRKPAQPKPQEKPQEKPQTETAAEDGK